MSKCPKLSEMDISRCDEITHYSLRQNGESQDILRIFYKRKKGSFLAERKTFKFSRIPKRVVNESAKSGSVEVYEISPFLQKALIELDSIVDQHNSDKNKTTLALKQVEELEKEVSYALHEIKSLLKSIKKDL